MNQDLLSLLLYDPYEYDRTVANFNCSNQVFKATGIQIVVMGCLSLLRPAQPESEKVDDLEKQIKG